jgi:hypothetical protein
MFEQGVLRFLFLVGAPEEVVPAVGRRTRQMPFARLSVMAEYKRLRETG